MDNFDDNFEPSQVDVSPSRFVWYVRTYMKWIIGGLGIFFIALMFLLSIRPGNGFEEKKIFTVASGDSSTSVAEKLHDQGFVRSPHLWLLWVQMRGEKVIAGDYLFEKPLWMFGLARRIQEGDYGDSRIRVGIPEGVTIEQMAGIISDQLDGFDRDRFISLAKNEEGYLFPDTYFFFPSTNTKNVYDTLRDAFNRMTDPLQEEIGASGRSFEDIITMASIIEKESYDDDEERAIISGILWKRIDIGMALQVDATFVYERDKGTADLTLDDLAEDSPYNTYTNRGLPPTPIGNPGLASIRAAIHPQESPYLFYLHGKDGIVRYARNHDEHVMNKNLYLR